MINIVGIDKARLLQALHNGTSCLGLGVLHDIGSMTLEQAKQIIEDSSNGYRPLYFDYVCGRPLKVNLSKGEFDPGLYDRDAGEGHAAKVVAALRDEIANERP